MSLRRRLVVGVVVLAAIALVGADVATYASLRSFLLSRTDSSLETDHRAVESVLQTAGSSCEEIGRSVPGVFVQLRTRTTGRVVCSTGVADFSRLPSSGGRPQPGPPPQRPPLRAAREELRVGPDRRERSPQLVQGVGDKAAELLLGGGAHLERSLDLAQHRVQREAQASHLGPVVGVLDPLGEVAGGICLRRSLDRA